MENNFKLNPDAELTKYIRNFKLGYISPESAKYFTEYIGEKSEEEIKDFCICGLIRELSSLTDSNEKEIVNSLVGTCWDEDKSVELLYNMKKRKNMILNNRELHQNLVDPEKSKYIQDKIKQLKEDIEELEVSYAKDLYAKKEVLVANGIREDALIFREIDKKIKEFERCEKYVENIEFLDVFDLIKKEQEMERESEQEILENPSQIDLIDPE